MAKKIILYGNENCPDCMKAKAWLDQEGIRYGYVDILAGLAHLKKFLALRDSHSDTFAAAISAGKIGIPVLVVDDSAIYVENLDQLDPNLLR